MSDQKPKHFTMLAFYRGLHCGACRDNLERLQSMHLTFSRLGVTAIAVSMDNAERASATEAEWDLTNLCVAYGLSLAQAKQWGLYVSRGRGRTSAGLEEPPLFVEPGLFLVRPDMTLYCACVQSMPLVRFSFEDVLDTLSAIIADSVPARGEVAD